MGSELIRTSSPAEALADSFVDLVDRCADSLRRKDILTVDVSNQPDPVVTPPQPKVVDQKIVKTESIPSGVTFSLRIPPSVILLGGYLVLRYGFKVKVPNVVAKA